MLLSAFDPFIDPLDDFLAKIAAFQIMLTFYAATMLQAQENAKDDAAGDPNSVWNNEVFSMICVIVGLSTFGVAIFLVVAGLGPGRIIRKRRRDAATATRTVRGFPPATATRIVLVLIAPRPRRGFRILVAPRPRGGFRAFVAPRPGGRTVRVLSTRDRDAECPGLSPRDRRRGSAPDADAP